MHTKMKFSKYFVNNDGKYALIICGECGKENNTENIALGICTWCGFDINKQFKQVNIQSNCCSSHAGSDENCDEK